MSATAAFIPPMPTPPRRASGALLSLLRARGDILSVFPESAYRSQLVPLSVPGRRIFLINHPDLIRHVFVTRHEIYQRKSRFMEQALQPVVGDSLFINHGKVWAERREVIAPSLYPSRVGHFHPVFLQVAEEMVEELVSKAPGPLDMSSFFAAATARVMMLALFGPSVPKEDATALADAFAAYQQAAANMDLRTLLNLPEWMSGRQNRHARRMAAELRALIARNLAAVREPTPLLRAMQEARRPDGTPVMDAQALANEAAMMLLAGSETSATALTWTTYLLAAHHPTLRTLMEEYARLSPGRMPTYEELSEMPVTRAVIQEALRLYPPVVILARQAAAEDELRGHKVQPGNMVMAVPWLLHRNANWWHEPHAFLPERFFPENARKQPKFTHIPFGIGPRVCAGAAFGQAEMAVFLAVLLRRFIPIVPAGWAPVPQCRMTLKPKDGMLLMLQRR